jgi:hypothetical protein
MVHLGKIKYDDLLREAEESRRVMRSPRVRRLPKMVQALILILS